MSNEIVLKAAQSVWEKAVGDKPSWPSFKEFVSKMGVKASFTNPPIPGRSFDYCAYDENTFDGTLACPIGHGETAQEAIEDLLSHHI